MYKAYIPATDSTLICRAWRYYRHHGPYDRRIRAMTYRAAVAEELGQPEQAMRWYKLTELDARRHHDNYNVGYALMSMAVLYQNNFMFAKAIEKFRPADSLLSEIDTGCSRFCQLQMAMLYLSDEANADSSSFYSQSALNNAIKANDSLAIAAALTIQSKALFYREQYRQSIGVAKHAIDAFPDHAPAQCWYFMSQSFLAVGDKDSAERYIALAPPPVTAADSVFFMHAKALLAEADGQEQEFHQYEEISDNIGENLDDEDVACALVASESDAAGEWNREQADAKAAIIYSVLALALIVLCVLVYVSSRRNRQAMREIEWLKQKHREQMPADSQSDAGYGHAGQLVQTTVTDSNNSPAMHSPMAIEPNGETTAQPQLISLQESLDSAHSDNEMLKQLYAKLSKAYCQVVEALGQIADDYYPHQQSANAFMKQFKLTFEKIWGENDTWAEIETHINHKYNNAIQRLNKLHPELTPAEKRLILLSVIGFDNTAIAICLNYKSPAVAAVMKTKLKKKLGIEGDLKAYITALQDLQP